MPGTMSLELCGPAWPVVEKRDRGRLANMDGVAAVAVLGGSETAARGVGDPYPLLLGRALGLEVVNLGLPNASPDAFLRDHARLARARESGLCVVAAMGAANMSNRLYAVHPRRNDRFLSPSPALRMLFPEVDFAEICFTRQLLLTLHDAAPERWGIVREELRIAWMARMRALLGRLPPAILLWTAPDGEEDGPLGPEPLFVTADMVEGLRPLVREVVAVTVGPRTRAEDQGRIAAALIDPVRAHLPEGRASGVA